MTMRQNLTSGFGGMLSACLAVLFSLQFALAHLHGTVSQQGQGLQLVICSGDQVRTITLDPVDGSVDERPTTPDTAGTGECPFCIVGVGALLDHPDRAAVPAELHPLRYPLTARPQPHPARPCLARAIRAPPSIA